MTINENNWHYRAKKDVADLFIAEGFADTSYGNDITASFCINGRNTCYVVYVFDADPNEREEGQSYRFYPSIWTFVDGEPDELITQISPTNDIDSVLFYGSINND